MRTYARKRARKEPQKHIIVDLNALSAETLLQFGVGTFGIFQALDEKVGVDATCGVCLERFAEDDLVVRCGNCTQFVHRICIDEWLQHAGTSRQCVFCRAVLTYTLL